MFASWHVVVVVVVGCCCWLQEGGGREFIFCSFLSPGGRCWGRHRGISSCQQVSESGNCTSGSRPPTSWHLKSAKVSTSSEKHRSWLIFLNCCTERVLLVDINGQIKVINSDLQTKWDRHHLQGGFAKAPKTLENIRNISSFSMLIFLKRAKKILKTWHNGGKSKFQFPKHI